MSIGMGMGLRANNNSGGLRASRPSLDLDFLTQRHSMSLLSKAFSDIITFSRPSASTRINPLGLVESVAAHVPCIDHSPVNLATGVGAQTLALTLGRSYAITAVGGTVAIAGAGVNVSQMGAAAGAIHTPAGVGTVDVTFTPGGGVTALHVREVLGIAVWEYRANYWVTATDPVAVIGGANSASAVASPVPWVNYTIFTEDTANTVKQLEFYKAGLISGKTYAFSVDVKPDTITSIEVWNFVSGILGSVNLLTGVSTNPAVKAEKNADGGYRLTWVVVAASSAVNFRIYFNSGNAFLGTGRRFYYANMQVEEGVFSTPRIPTTTAQVARAGDVMSINTLSPWFKAAGGAIYVEYDNIRPGTLFGGMISFQSAGVPQITLGQGTGYGLTNAAYLNVKNLGVNVADIYGLSNTTLGAIVKACFRFAKNDFAISVNSSPVSGYAVDGAGDIPVVDSMLFVPGGIHIRKLKFLPKPPSDSMLQSLTA